MLSCPSSARPPYTCPTLEQSIQATAALFPRGKAWPVSDGGNTVDAFLNWLANLGGDVYALADPYQASVVPDIYLPLLPRNPSQWPPGFVQAGFAAALGTVRNWIESRFCNLKNEFFCSSAAETLDLWNAEYGLPDHCDPFPDLCAKVAMVGGTPDCAFWTGIAATLGWTIECNDYRSACGSQAGCSLAGTAFAGEGIQPATIVITVVSEQSPAYQYTGIAPLAGLVQSGMQLNCAPNITSLSCAFDRISPAHYQFKYLLI
jgi:uncharacterized protein YmfQ (DUF2313 family)